MLPLGGPASEIIWGVETDPDCGADVDIDKGRGGGTMLTCADAFMLSTLLPIAQKYMVARHMVIATNRLSGIAVSFENKGDAIDIGNLEVNGLYQSGFG